MSQSQSLFPNSPSASQKGKADDKRLDTIKEASLNTGIPSYNHNHNHNHNYNYNPPLPLTIPTKSQSLSSGFPYHPALSPLHIPPDQWAEFSAQLVAAAAKLTLPARVAAVGAGIGASLVTPLTTGYYVGKWVRDKSVVRRVGREVGRRGSEVNRVLGAWNENVFAVVGVVVRLVVPGDGEGEGDGEDNNGLSSSGEEKTKKARASAVKNLFERRDQRLTFRLVVSPLDWEGKAAQELGSAQPVDYEMAGSGEARRFVAELDATPLETGKGRLQELPS
ncbi:hypothetical protein FQN50_003531 [Emmonsiellopsis sp. PD_5]|nr:hypothetical protein FQN50_003531 [Emmonsiellopsis sp. PD_5]